MTKRYGILQKKLIELESQLHQLVSLPPESTPYHQRFSQDIQQRFHFLKNLLSAEIASHPRKPSNLQDIAQRLLDLEAAFQEWDRFQTSAADHHVDKSSTWSCAESCVNDEGEAAEGSSELMSLADFEQVAEAATELSLSGLDFEVAGKYLEGSDDEDRMKPLPVENVKTSSAIEAETEKRKEDEEKIWGEAQRSMKRKEKNSEFRFGKCLGNLASGVVLGMALMGFLMVRFSCCFCCYGSDSDYTFYPTPT